MRTKSLNKAKLVVKVEGNKSTREIITKSVFDNRTQTYWTDGHIRERGINKFINIEDMIESLNWNLNGDSSKFQFKWGLGGKNTTDGMAYVFD